ncbi:MAG: amino acid racemase [Spirochaetes bacterium]|nr:amino acid racemase [Spirochaetota bacterium]
MQNEMRPPVIGVIGGMGPYAGLDFVQKIFGSTKAKKDQDHLNCVLVSLPGSVSDRTAFLLRNEGENPAAGMFESARRLHLAGASYAAVACNTAHAKRIFEPFCEAVKKELSGLVIVNMLESCAEFIKKERGGLSRIGLLATVGTHQSGVYGEYFRKEDGFTLLEPDAAGKENIHEAIYNEGFGIKSFSQPVTERARALVSGEINRLAEKGAQAVILGCTELPLAIPPGATSSIQLIDPGLIAARKLVSLAAPERLAE